MKELYMSALRSRRRRSRMKRAEKRAFFLRLLQQGELLSLPHSRPMPSIGKGCHELRIIDKDSTWRIVYYVDAEAIVILDSFLKRRKKHHSK